MQPRSTQPKTAIILSLGMLIDKMETYDFIRFIWDKAYEAPGFVFSPTLLADAFVLSEQLNRNEITEAAYKAGVLKIFDIEQMDDALFWQEFNKMLTIGDISKNIGLLQKQAQEQNVLIYLHSDTNKPHFNLIADECKQQGIPLEFEQAESSVTVAQKPTLAGMPLFLSFQYHKNRLDLLSIITQEIHSKQLNKPDKIVLVLGDPENNKNRDVRDRKKAEVATIRKWCAENSVIVQLHKDALAETLDKILNPAPPVNDTLTRSLHIGANRI